MLVQFTPASQRDLVDMARFIASDSPQRAATFAAELISACEALGFHPERYAITPRYAEKAYRRRPFGHYSIIYAIDQEDVRVVRVVSSWVDLDTVLDD